MPFPNQPHITRFGSDPLLAQELATKNYVDNNAGGGNTFARVIKKVRETIVSDIVLQDDDEIIVALEANKIYAFFLNLQFTGGVGGLRYAFSLPAGATGSKRLAGDWDALVERGMGDITVASQVPSVSGGLIVNSQGFITMGGTAGNMTFQWAQNTSSATISAVDVGTLLTVYESLP